MIILVAVTMFTCNNGNKTSDPGPGMGQSGISDNAVLFASDINYDVIVKPPSDGDPWQAERVSGYEGGAMINDIFEKLYNGTITARHITTGEPLKPQDIKTMERELGTDRSLIAKIQFTEDWFYHPSTGRIEKVVKEIIMGYEFRDSQGNLFGYKALFSVGFTD